jgi:hypothetical protein
MTTAAARPSSAGGVPLQTAALRRAQRAPPCRPGEQHEATGKISAEMPHITLTVPCMNKPPSRNDVTVRVAKEDGHPPNPAAFAAAASQAASSRNVSIISAHTAEEIICVVSVTAPDRPAAVAVALAVVADALRAGDPVPSPSR